jgi:hypothetical protein
LPRIENVADNLTAIAEESTLFRDVAQRNLQYEGADPEIVANTVNAVADALVEWTACAPRTFWWRPSPLDRSIASTQTQLEAATAGGPEELQLQNRLAAQQQTRADVAANIGTASSRLEVILHRACGPASP